MLQKMEILNFPPLSVELEMSTTAECNPPFVVVGSKKLSKYVTSPRKYDIIRPK